ncbi:MAG: hypothetical protein M0R80_13805 [Proteobacteria bacterium]|jgi:hypothetical protein|nr:hypothetical protein [Pseudomonadota bacterium]
MLLGPGKTFYVDSVHGGASYDGLSWATALTTIDLAINKCTASHGDNILVAPYHAETLVDAAGLVCDTAGINIIGIGRGAAIPTITLGTATAATITVTAADVSFYNIKVIAALANIAAGITASAAGTGLTVENCWFCDSAIDKELVIGISLATGADNVLIRNNRFTTVISAGTGGCASAIKFVGTHTNCRIIGNYIHGNYSAACIDGITGAGIFADIYDNRLINIDTDAGLVINMKSDTTGFVARNLCVGILDTAAPVVGAALAAAENYGSNALGASGIIKPAVDS